MKIENLSALSEKFVERVNHFPELIKKYPVELLLGVTYTLLFTILVLIDVFRYGYMSSKTSEIITPYVPVLALAFFLNRPRIKVLYYASFFICLVPVLFLEKLSGQQWFVIYFIAFLLLFMSQPKSNANFLTQVECVASSLFYTCLIEMVLLVLVFLIGWSVDTLLGGGKSFEDIILCVCLPVTPVAFILSVEVFSSKGGSIVLSALLKYVFSPALVIYSLILYAYSVKIIVTHQLPDGGVAYMVLSYVSIALGTYMLSSSWEKNPFRWFYRWFPFISILPMLLLWSGIVRRLSDYGFTQERVYLLAMTIVYSLFLFILVFERTRSFQYLIVALIIGAFVLTYVPGISAKDIAIRNQKQRLESVLPVVTIDGFFREPDVEKIKKDPELEKSWRKAQGAYEYLKEHNQISEYEHYGKWHYRYW